MAWITQIRIADSRTVKNEDVNHKCEREMTLSFPMGELKADDKALISKWARETGELVKAEIDLYMRGITPEVKGRDSETKKDDSESATPKQVAFVKDLIARLSKKYPNLLSDLLKEYEVDKLEDMTKGQISGAIELLKEKK